MEVKGHGPRVMDNSGREKWRGNRSYLESAERSTALTADFSLYLDSSQESPMLDI